MTKPLCLVFANCQGLGLAHFLRKANFPFEIRTFENYRFILKEQDPAEFKELAKRADVFIYQPTHPKYDDLCAQNIVDGVLPKHCKTVSFPYLFNSGIAPLLEHGQDICGAEYVRALMDVCSNEEILQRYEDGTINFGMTARFLACAAEQARREVFCDIKMAPWMVDNRHLFLMFTANHPTSHVFWQLAWQTVLEVGTYSFVNLHEFNKPVHWNEVGLPCQLPVSRYTIKEFGIVGMYPDTTPELDSEKCYRDLLLRVLETRGK